MFVILNIQIYYIDETRLHKIRFQNNNKSLLLQSRHRLCSFYCVHSGSNGLWKMDKKRTDLSNKEKVDIFEKYDALPPMSQRKATIALGIPQPTLSKMLKKWEKIFENPSKNGNLSRKRKRTGKDADVEGAPVRQSSQKRSCRSSFIVS